MKGAGSLVPLLVLVVGLAGCVDETGFTFGVDPERIRCTDTTGVDNRMSSFSYGGTATCKTANEAYDWSNPTPRAEVSWGGATAAGSVEVSIFDSLDQLVYHFKADGTGASGATGTSDFGMPGPAMQTWRIQVEFLNFTGTMGLNVDSTL